MFQPEVKLEFVKRYCNPRKGWEVFVDIDPSEEGRTGGPLRTEVSWKRRSRMQRQAKEVRRQFEKLGVQVGGSRKGWFQELRDRYSKANIPDISGDRDIVAIHPESRSIVIAEVEGESAGQPETKLYKAIGQIVTAVGEVDPPGYHVYFFILVSGDKIKAHLKKASALRKIGVCGVSLGSTRRQDRVLFDNHKLASRKRRIGLPSLELKK